MIGCNQILNPNSPYNIQIYKTICIDNRLDKESINNIKNIFEKWSISTGKNYIMITFKVVFDINGGFNYRKQVNFCDIYILK